MKKRPTPQKKPNALVSEKFTGIETPRQLRVVLSLLTAPKTREQIDGIAGASNGPEVIRQLRVNGLGIVCHMEKHIDRDGRKGSHGVYTLPMSERMKFCQWRAAMESRGLL